MQVSKENRGDGILPGNQDIGWEIVLGVLEFENLAVAVCFADSLSPHLVGIPVFENSPRAFSAGVHAPRIALDDSRRSRGEQRLFSRVTFSHLVQNS